MPSKTYTLLLPPNQWVPLTLNNFFQATDGAPMPQETLVRLKQDGDFLSIEFECKNDPYWSHTTHTRHNSDLWQQEVFEVFIAEGEQTPTRYLEVEINPNNALFTGWVENPSGEGDANVLSMLAYGETGILHQITGSTPDSWRGELRIPLRLICQPDSPSASSTFRINFYRIVLTQPQTDPHWVCDTENCLFQCWSPTFSGSTPRFHRPECFGILHLQ